MQDGALAVVIQPQGLLHRFIRSKDTSTVVERPERLRAVAVGIAAAGSRLDAYSEPSAKVSEVKVEKEDGDASDSLAAALNRLDLSAPANNVAGDTNFSAFQIITSVAAPATLANLSDKAVEFVHGETREYLDLLKAWASTSEDKIRAGGSEIPTGYSQGDLYLCPRSMEAISGSIAAVCQGVDISVGQVATASPAAATLLPPNHSGLAIASTAVSNSLDEIKMEAGSIDASQVPLPPSPLISTKPLDQKTPRVFVAVRPPGHHCSDEKPSGFCFVNNVMIAASHAHIRHGIRRIIVLDFDLHHGNGTQAIAWSINAETSRKLEEHEAQIAAGQSPQPAGPQVYYASLHDILSFPCEDGDAQMVQAASTNLSGAHGQYIENVHLEPYSSEEDFFNRLYPAYYQRLFGGAVSFLERTSGPRSSADDTMVFISAGFDASPHEHSYMSRHNRNVPTAFYTKFAQDATVFAEQYARGRIVSVLEGGYSDAALISASAAYISGLALPDEAQNIIEQRWWETDSLELLEKLTKPVARGAKPRQSKNATPAEPTWLVRTREIIETSMDGSLFAPLPALPNLRPNRQQATPSGSPSSKMTLRDRTKRETPAGASTAGKNPPQSPPKAKARQSGAGAPTQTPATSPPKPKQAAPPVSRRTTPSTRPPASQVQGPSGSKPESKARVTSRPPVSTQSAALRLAGNPRPAPTTTVRNANGGPLKIRLKIPPRANSTNAVSGATGQTAPVPPLLPEVETSTPPVDS